MRRRTERLLASIHLPDSVGAIGMSGGSTQNAGPKHEALHFLTTGLDDTLIAHFPDEHWHFGRPRQ